MVSLVVVTESSSTVEVHDVVTVTIQVHAVHLTMSRLFHTPDAKASSFADSEGTSIRGGIQDREANEENGCSIPLQLLTYCVGTI